MLGHRISCFLYVVFLKFLLCIQCDTMVTIWSKTLAPFPKMKEAWVGSIIPNTISHCFPCSFFFERDVLRHLSTDVFQCIPIFYGINLLLMQCFFDCPNTCRLSNWVSDVLCLRVSFVI